VSFSPKNGSRATATKITVWPMAMIRLMPTRASTTVPGRIGASRSRRRIRFSRQVTSVSAAPNVAPVAIAQPSRPGVMNWIVFSDSSSTCWASSEYLGGWPLSAWFEPSTSELKIVRTVPARTTSAAE
jgi:hypothetical protein